MIRENRTVPFRQWGVRVSRGHDGGIHVCAADLCEILRREELVRDGSIAGVCPTALKVPFRKGGREKWGIRPADMRRLLRYVRRDGALPRDLLDDLEAWGNTLLELENSGRLSPVQSDTVRFFREDFPVSFRVTEGRLMVNATQITVPLGHIPSEWLRVASTDRLRREMARDGRTGRYESQIFTTRGRGSGATWIEAPLVIPLARWVAPGLSLAEWCGRQIGELTPKPAVPAAKGRSGRAQTCLICLDCPVPEEIGEARKLIARLRDVLREALPKMDFYEEFIENREWFKSTRLADELGISPYQLHQFLAGEGICKYEKRQWVVFPSYRALQCDVPYTWVNGRGKAFTFGSTKRWTQAGREYILDLWHRKNPEYQNAK